MAAIPTVDLLVFPQWQGYAAGEGPRRGALAIAAALDGRRGHVEVPEWHPLAGGDVLGLEAIVGQAVAALAWLDAAAPERLLVIGGDCGSDFAPMCWQAARLGDELGVLYLDAHADLNTPASSPSRRFHGMVLRAALGDGAPALAALCPRPLATGQVILAGSRDVDAGERAFVSASASDITLCAPAAIADGGVLAAVGAHRARRWHVHLDLDVLDPSDFPEVTVPTPGGPSLDEVARLLVELVGRHDVVGITVTEHVGGEASARRVAAVVAALGRAGWR